MPSKLDHYWNALKGIVDAHPKHRPFDEAGKFYPDPTPVAPPIGYVQEPSMFDRVREMVRRETSRVAADKGFESFEEANDFDTDDYEEEPFSPYEEIVEQLYPDGPTTQPEVNAAAPQDGQDPPPEAPKSQPPEAAASAK